MSVVLVDDHLLLRILLDDEPPSLRTADDSIATTGLWYHRLCRALGDGAVVGALSRRLGAVDESIAADVLGAVVDLPESIGLVSLRDLGWDMGTLLRRGCRLNLLGLEALAAARHLEATILVAEVDDNLALREAAEMVGVATRVVAG
ncbi:MAG: hypothetical protein R2746_05975 [Acidimicrobiales bacterium]|nr:hypothetical protein [Actinomycetota bacterium]